jgi:dTDP-4-amino-4,6-dideoxygalactose transaminase
MAYAVPFVDSRKHYAVHKQDIDGAILDCLSSGDLIYRRHLKEFEEHLAAYVGTKYAVGLNSGYHALAFALTGVGVGAGDEVITVAHTFVATVSAIVHAGAKPVLIDVAPDYNMDLDQLEAAITPRTRAILPVHLNGRVCNMERLMAIADRRGLPVIEDAAQALGARYDTRRGGSFGIAGCFSFYPFKTLGGFGDGGAITTNDEKLATYARRIRFNGEDRETGEYHHHGYTALLDNVQAAVLDVKLTKHFDRWIAHRHTMAERYGKGLQGVADLRLPHFSDPKNWDNYQNYVVRTKRREELRAFLKEQSIETLVHWARPMWEHRGLGLVDPGLPETAAISAEVISLPMSAELTPEHVDTVVAAIRSFFGRA